MNDIRERCKADPAKYKATIRRLAKKQGYIARRRTRVTFPCGLWWFSDERNVLQSPEMGLDDEEALEWLLQ
jgi:hypothetical protein